ISQLAYNEAKKESLEINLEKEKALDDYQLDLEELNLWFSEEIKYEVSSELNLIEEDFKTNFSIENHPELKEINSKISQVKAEYKQAKAARLPKLNLEYGFQRLNGNNGYFSYQAGIAIPFFSGDSKAEKRKKYIAQEIVENEENFKREKLKINYQKAIRNLEKWRKSYFFYEEETLPL